MGARARLPRPRGVHLAAGRVGDEPECTDEVCITCGDVAIPARIVELRPGDLALVEAEAGARKSASRSSMRSVGDVVLVHAKEAIGVIP